jgi:hypothetical protein
MVGPVVPSILVMQKVLDLITIIKKNILPILSTSSLVGYFLMLLSYPSTQPSAEGTLKTEL